MAETGPFDGDRIVVVGQWRQGQGRLPLAYTRAVAAAGGRVRIASAFHVPASHELPSGVEVLDGREPKDVSVLDGAAGLLLPGGGDIDPSWYGRPRHPQTHNVNHLRDRFELGLLEVALDRDMPVLAICHGMQLLNVLLGGTLDQHLADSPQRVDHDDGNPQAKAVHELRVNERSVLAGVLGASHLKVNSHHHQGVADVASDLQEVAWAEDGVLEAVVDAKHMWVVGVQWHPEVMAPIDGSQASLFRAFVEAAESYAARVGPAAKASA